MIKTADGSWVNGKFIVLVTPIDEDRCEVWVDNEHSFTVNYNADLVASMLREIK